MKKVAVLLNNQVANDYRVIKTIRSISKIADVDLFYVNGEEADEELFENGVRLFSFEHRATFKVKLLRHSFFFNEFNFLADHVMNTGVKYTHVWANDLPTLKPAAIIADKLDAKVIYDSHEIYVETLNQFFPLSTSAAKKFVFNFFLSIMKKQGEKAERSLLKKVDTFITVNESIVDYFRNKYGLQTGLSIMNLPHSNRASDSFDYRKKYQWDNRSVIFIYQGVLNEGRGIKKILETIRSAPNNYKLIVLGNGTLKKELKEFTNQFNLSEQVKFIDKVPLDTLPNFTAGADIGFNLLEDLNLSKKLASPNKLFEYIHANKPVVCTNTIENKKVIDTFKIGVLVNNNTASILKGMEDAIVLKKDEQTLSELKRCADHYNWEKQEPTLLAIFK